MAGEYNKLLVTGTAEHAVESLKKMYNLNGIVSVTPFHKTVDITNYAEFNEQCNPGALANTKAIFYGRVTVNFNVRAINVLTVYQAIVNLKRPVKMNSASKMIEAGAVKQLIPTPGFNPPTFNTENYNFEFNGMFVDNIEMLMNSAYGWVVFDGMFIIMQ